MYSGFQGYQRTDNNVFLNLRNLKITGIYAYILMILAPQFEWNLINEYVITPLSRQQYPHSIHPEIL